MSIDSGRLQAAILAKTAPDKKEEQDEAPESADVSEGAIAAAEDIMDVFSSYSGSPVSDSDSKVEKATKEAARRAKAKILAGALKNFLECCD